MRKEANRRRSRCARFFSFLISLNSNWVVWHACVSLVICRSIYETKKKQRNDIHRKKKFNDAVVKHVFSCEKKESNRDLWCLLHLKRQQEPTSTLEKKNYFWSGLFWNVLFFSCNSIGIRLFCRLRHHRLFRCVFILLWKWHTISTVLHTVCREKERRMGNSSGNWSANVSKTSNSNNNSHTDELNGEKKVEALAVCHWTNWN